MKNLNIKSKIVKNIQDPNPLLQALIGPRQVGKTTLAKSIYEDWPYEKMMVLSLIHI